MKTLGISLLVTAFITFASLIVSAADSEPEVQVSADGRDLIVKRTPDEEAVVIPVLNQCGDPAVGAARIRHLEFVKDSLIATYGKHCSATISLETLNVECTGCD